MRFTRILLILGLSLHLFHLSGQEQRIRFAFLTDLHYAEGAPSVQDLRTCIRDVNAQEGLDFVLVGGDLTDFGSDEEIRGVKHLLDSLRYRYYVVAGNHDAKWSESGCNTFSKVFGYEHFEFECKGWRFIGCNCGPDMRMAPALVPRESLEWLGSLEKGPKTLFINHYPQDTSVLNYFEVTKELKRIGTRLVIGGHWHRNTALHYDGLPGFLGRSTLSAGINPGYSIVTVENDRVTVAERRIYGSTTVQFEPWYGSDLPEVKDTVTYDADGLPAGYPWMRYDVNDEPAPLRLVWKRPEQADIASGFARDKNRAWYATASGTVRCISWKDGRRIWSRNCPGKIFSTPAVHGKHLVFGCTDGFVYALNPKNGRLRWKYRCGKSVLGSPVIFQGKVFIGASDGCFRALDLKSGKALWTFSEVEGFIECRPYVDAEQVVFGSWGNRLYSLDPGTGSLQWVWKCERPSRMYSPAATWPVKAAGKIFIAVPDRRLYALDAGTGKEIGHFDNLARESVGLSEDGGTVYCKSMFHKLAAIDARSLAVRWQVENHAGYDISPTAVEAERGLVLMPTDKGNLLLFDPEGRYLGARKLSVALLNPLEVWTDPGTGRLRVLASTMDGQVAMYEYSEAVSK